MKDNTENCLWQDKAPEIILRLLLEDHLFSAARQCHVIMQA
jgi:hypothetical protein